MKRPEFKSVVSDFLTIMCESWFDGLPFMKGLGISLINANINKFDNLIELFEDETGNIDIKGMVDNMGRLKEPIKIDLRQYSPLLPARTLLITQEDLDELVRYAEQREKG